MVLLFYSVSCLLVLSGIFLNRYYFFFDVKIVFRVFWVFRVSRRFGIEEMFGVWGWKK